MVYEALQVMCRLGEEVVVHILGRRSQVAPPRRGGVTTLPGTLSDVTLRPQYTSLSVRRAGHRRGSGVEGHARKMSESKSALDRLISPYPLKSFDIQI